MKQRKRISGREAVIALNEQKAVLYLGSRYRKMFGQVNVYTPSDPDPYSPTTFWSPTSITDNVVAMWEDCEIEIESEAS
jgi:hypothetical protein